MTTHRYIAIVTKNHDYSSFLESSRTKLIQETRDWQGIPVHILEIEEVSGWTADYYTARLLSGFFKAKAFDSLDEAIEWSTE